MDDLSVVRVIMIGHLAAQNMSDTCMRTQLVLALHRECNRGIFHAVLGYVGVEQFGGGPVQGASCVERRGERQSFQFCQEHR